MTSQPLVSIVIPTYNGSRYLASTLRSAQHQDWEHLEIIVSDDGSTDETLDLVRAAARDDTRIRVMERRHNVGAPVNQRELYAAARGEYLKPLLQDDLLEPNAITRLVEPLIADRALAFSTSRRRLIDQHGWPLADVPSMTPLASVSSKLDGHSVAELLLRTVTNRVGEVSTALMRSELVASTTLWWWGSYCFTVNADIWLWLQLLRRGDLWYEIETLSSFRIHPGQSSRERRTGVIGVRDWVRLLEAAPGLGFLTDVHALRTAAAGVLAEAAWQRSTIDDPALIAMLDKVSQDLERLAGSRQARDPDRRAIGASPAPVIEPEGCELVLHPDWSDLSSLHETVIAYVRAFDHCATSSLVILHDETSPWSAGELGRYVAVTLTDNGHDPELVAEIVITESHRLDDLADGRRRIRIGQPPSDVPCEWSPTPRTPDGYRALASGNPALASSRGGPDV